MDGFDNNNNGRRPFEIGQTTLSYFKNVVALSPDTMSPVLSPKATGTPASSGKTNSGSGSTTRKMSGENSDARNATAASEETNNGGAGDDLVVPQMHGSNKQILQHDGHATTAANDLAINGFNAHNTIQGQEAGQIIANVRSRKGGNHHPKMRQQHHRGRRRKRRPSDHHQQYSSGTENASSSSRCCPSWCFGSSCGGLFWCCNDRKIVRSTLSCMNVVARILSWCTVVASVAGVVWYSYELKKTGKDPHLILWNSAAAFVLIGFPISIYGIVMHLSNYNQPETQNYIVRILWMVPLFSIQSWLGLRFKDYSIYFETIRDWYEAYVLYSFLQFLIQVLGGEEALILMLKDKSPTRGVHIGGLQLCVKPWLMGQPVRKTLMNNEGETILAAAGISKYSMTTRAGGSSSTITASETSITGVGGLLQTGQQQHHMNQPARSKPLKRVYWTSPFFLHCKFGVLQYVLLKFVSSIAILILEPHDLYKEGSFSYKGGYLYICILTNVSQTWALYCFFFFYFATKNELTPIRPVGKFLSVKLLVFFTWWQSLFISILYQMQLIPHYTSTEAKLFGSGGAGSNDESVGLGVMRPEPDWSVPLSAEDATALDEYGGNAFWLPPVESVSSGIIEYSAEDVAKALQDYLICIEMFIFAIVHIFVFPHSEYSPEAVDARARALNQRPNKNWNKRLGRKWKEYDNKSAWSGTTNTSRDSVEIELFPVNGNQRDYSNSQIHGSRRKDSIDEYDLRVHPMDDLDEMEAENYPLLLEEEREDSFDFEDDIDGDSSYSDEDELEMYDNFTQMDEEQGKPKSRNKATAQKKNFFSALLDSTIPQDLRDNTVGIIKGDYVVERKTLLHHAATSDSYDLLSRVPKHKGENAK